MRNRYSKAGLILGLVLAASVPISTVSADESETYDFNATPNAGGEPNAGGFSGGQDDYDVTEWYTEEQKLIDEEAKSNWVEENSNHGATLQEGVAPTLPDKIAPTQQPVDRDLLAVGNTYADINHYATMEYYEKLPAEVRPSLVNFDRLASEGVGSAIKNFGTKVVVRDHYLVRDNMHGFGTFLGDKDIEYSIEIVQEGGAQASGKAYFYDNSINNLPYTDDYRNKALSVGKWTLTAKGYEISTSSFSGSGAKPTEVYPQVNLVPDPKSVDPNPSSPSRAMVVDKGLANYPGAVIPTKGVVTVDGKSVQAVVGIRVAAVNIDQPDQNNNSNQFTYQHSGNGALIQGNRLKDYVTPNGEAIRTVIPLSDSVYPAWSYRFNPELGNYQNTLFAVSGSHLIWADKAVLNTMPSGTMTFAVLTKSGRYHFVSLAIMNKIYNYTSYQKITPSEFNAFKPKIFLNSFFFGNEDNPFAKKTFNNGSFAVTASDLSRLDTLAFSASLEHNSWQHTVAYGPPEVLNKAQNHTIEDFDLRVDKKLESDQKINLFSWDRTPASLVKINETKSGDKFLYEPDKNVTTYNFAEFYRINGNSLTVRSVYNTSLGQSYNEPLIPVFGQDIACLPVLPMVNGRMSCSQTFTYIIEESKRAVFPINNTYWKFSSFISLSPDVETSEINVSATNSEIAFNSEVFDTLPGQKVKLKVIYTNSDGNSTYEILIIDVKRPAHVQDLTHWSLSTNVFSTNPRASTHVDVTVYSTEDTLEGRVRTVWVGDSTQVIDHEAFPGEADKDIIPLSAYRVEGNQIIISKEFLANHPDMNPATISVDYGGLRPIELYIDINSDWYPSASAVPIEC